MGYKHWNYNQFNARSVANTVDANFVIRPTPAAGMSYYITDIALNAGATARTWQLLDGAYINAATITGNTQANPTVVTCGVYVPTGTIVIITGSNSTPSINGTYVATNTSGTAFSIPVNVTVAGTAGTVNAGAATNVVWAYTTVANTPVANVNLQVPIRISSGKALVETNGGASVGGQIFVNGFIARS